MSVMKDVLLVGALVGTSSYGSLWEQLNYDKNKKEQK